MNGITPLVSIVTPVYNDALYLPDCIESVIKQSYQHWDYVIVDNCSTDGSLEIARSYAAKDSRIRVVANETFLPAIPNHNRALRTISAAAKYCKVVLADDWLFPECLAQMVGVAEEHASVGVVAAYGLSDERVLWTGLPYPSRLLSGRDVCRRHFLNDIHVFGSATGVLYRADLVRAQDPFYTESNVHADVEVCFTLLKDADFAFVHQILTYSRARAQSLGTVAAELQTCFPGYLRLLVSNGPDYLTSAELDSCLKRHLRLYYRFLGKSALLGRHNDFWAYHKRQMKESGIEFNPARVALGAFVTVCQALVKPGLTLRALERRRRQNRTLSVPAGAH